MDNTNKNRLFYLFLKEISRKICRNQKKVLPLHPQMINRDL
ncbi:hypothetical protein PREVCOP_04895 [Segatella copri DSM 18205]|jgi:hypothetical protein|uniref:Uncharacterized protein n=1 Tax=Segatella copri DSM 18205 TaxID=537011 RepID=D1PCG2_9BACT|nr:hypothetical protein PREVCOP_04895 [Segatella copri DSM 18205]DAS42192.1 MAG TPA: hypothetical protein [Caudoviricetes sp.]